MLFTDDACPIIEGRYYELEDGRIVGPATPVVSGVPSKWLRVMAWGAGNYEIPGYRHDEDTPVIALLAKEEPEPTPEPPEPDYTEFLKELGELSRKHGFIIDGCGCCGSPFLKGDGEPYEDEVTYVVDGGDNLRVENP